MCDSIVGRFSIRDVTYGYPRVCGAHTDVGACIGRIQCRTVFVNRGRFAENGNLKRGIRVTQTRLLRITTMLPGAEKRMNGVNNGVRRNNVSVNFRTWLVGVPVQIVRLETWKNEKRSSFLCSMYL